MGEIEISGMKFKTIPISEIPSVERSNWSEIFSQISEGKALHITTKQVNEPTIRSALKRRQTKGKFTNLEYVTRTINGEKHIYVVRRRNKKRGNSHG